MIRGLGRSYTEVDKTVMIDSVFDFRRVSSVASVNLQTSVFTTQNAHGQPTIVVFNLSIKIDRRRSRVCSCHASTTSLEMCGLHVCSILLSVCLLDISRIFIINYRWPAAIGLVPLWQPAKYV